MCTAYKSKAAAAGVRAFVAASHSAGWLAARQLFAAFIVTSATLLAKRTVIIVPATSIRITDNFLLSVADLTCTTLTVLWFAQIFPKHLGR